MLPCKRRSGHHNSRTRHIGPLGQVVTIVMTAAEKKGVLLFNMGGYSANFVVVGLVDGLSWRTQPQGIVFRKP